MPVSFTLPLLEQKPSSTRDLVFSILSQHHPLSVAELRAEMRKKYSKAVSFQAVHKAVLQLLNEGVLSQEGKKLTLNRQWVLDLVRFSNQLHKSYFAHTPSAERMVVGSNVMVYTVDSLADMDLVWNSIIVDNFKKNPTQPRVIACEALHFWFVLVNLGAETELTKDVLHNDIDIYYLNYGGTQLDQWTVRHYVDIGVRSKVLPKPSEFDNSLVVGAFGDLVIQARYCAQVTERLNSFFRKYRTVQEAKLSELVEIASAQMPFQLTVIKDAHLASSLRHRIVSKFS